MRRRVLCALVLALSAARPAAAQAPRAGGAAAPARAEVLVLGLYHMANPGHDIYNMRADDVLAPKRQAEIGEVVEALKRFRPTKVAVEADVQSDRVPKAYADYVAGRNDLTRNETEQIGFRLARELGHKAIFAVDVDGDFPYQRLVNYAKGAGRSKDLDAIMGVFGAMTKAQGEFLASHTILETLVYMNADERADESLGLYLRMAGIGEPGDWAGADLVADWFRRNVRIYSNVAGLASAPNERVLAIFGAGHLGWLRQDVVNDPTLRLRKLAELVP
jgi:hypothetical protein